MQLIPHISYLPQPWISHMTRESMEVLHHWGDFNTLGAARGHNDRTWAAEINSKTSSNWWLHSWYITSFENWAGNLYNLSWFIVPLVSASTSLSLFLPVCTESLTTHMGPSIIHFALSGDAAGCSSCSLSYEESFLPSSERLMHHFKHKHEIICTIQGWNSVKHVFLPSGQRCLLLACVFQP